MTRRNIAALTVGAITLATSPSWAQGAAPKPVPSAQAAVPSAQAALPSAAVPSAGAPSSAAPSNSPSTAKPAAAKAPPTAEAIEEAKLHYQRGTELYTDGDFKLALIEFERAYELTDNARVLYNIGQVNSQLNNYAAALRNLEQYLRDAGDDVAADRRKQVESDIKVLKARTATIGIVVNVPDVEVVVDDQSQGRPRPGEKLLVDAGARRVTVQKEGYLPVTKRVTLAGGDAVTVSFDLKALHVESKEPTTSPLIYAGWGGTTLLAGGAILTGVLALGKHHDAQDLGSPATPAASVDAARAQASAFGEANSSAKTLSIVSDVFTVAAVALGGVTLYYTIKGPSKEGKRPVGLTLTPGLGGGTAALRF